MLLQTMMMFLMLLQTQAASSQYRGFPYGEPCNVLKCEALVWKLNWTSVVKTTHQMKACFKVSRTSCKDTSKYNCCKEFSNFIPKIDLSTNPACAGKISSVTVNGKKLAKVEVSTFRNQVTKRSFSEVRLWDVNLTGATAPGATVCLTVSAPCNDLEFFCKDVDDGKCKYSILNARNGHTCCPTCSFAQPLLHG